MELIDSKQKEYRSGCITAIWWGVHKTIPIKFSIELLKDRLYRLYKTDYTLSVRATPK